ncbi:hypothetical protein LJC05_03065 [Bacteroides sp. OttesenSCG-928-J23]|nr:hypothetical protein [Bacteroides sp. OttesenSCG-928-J23]
MRVHFLTYYGKGVSTLKGFGLPGLPAIGKVSPREIEKIVDSLGITAEESPEIIDSESVRVAAVQVMLRRYSSLAEYVFDLNLYLADAVNRRAQLVCFPDWCGLLPLGFHPRLNTVLEPLRPKEGASFPDPDALFELFSRLGDQLFDTTFQTMSLLASRHRVWVMAGTVPYFDGDDLRLRALLFDRHGELAGFQDKLTLTSYQKEVGFTSAEELRIFQTPAGLVAILAGSDSDYFELGRIAKNMGAQILLCPRNFTGEYTPVRAALGVNMRVQETHTFGVQSVLVGNTGMGIVLEGAAQLFAPNGMVRTKNGVLLRAQLSGEPDIICGQLSMERLQQLTDPYTQDKNMGLMGKHFDKLY